MRVLFVCTGNVCRSPMGQRLLHARLAGRHDGLVETSSAGTHALSGYGMDAASAGVLRELGGEPDGHVARQLTAELVRDADLVLTADVANRAIVLRGNPAALRRVFTMREFARLGSGLGRVPDDADALVARIAEVAARRGVVPPAEPGGDDIGDPFGAPLPIVQRCGAQVREAVDGIVAGLGL